MQPTQRLPNVSFPMWQFLTQPLFISKKVILNPVQFWKHYNLQQLERCWDYDAVQILERCWMKELESKSSSNQCFQE